MTKNAQENERQKGIISINHLMAGVKVTAAHLPPRTRVCKLSSLRTALFRSSALRHCCVPSSPQCAQCVSSLLLCAQFSSSATVLIVLCLCTACITALAAAADTAADTAAVQNFTTAAADTDTNCACTLTCMFAKLYWPYFNHLNTTVTAVHADPYQALCSKQPSF
jgi:hypothetical protein